MKKSFGYMFALILTPHYKHVVQHVNIEMFDTTLVSSV